MFICPGPESHAGLFLFLQRTLLDQSESCKKFRMTSTRPLVTALNVAARDFGSLLNASKAGQVSLGRSQRQQPHYRRGHDQGPLGEPVLGRSNDRQLDPNDG